jgi:nitroreductase
MEFLELAKARYSCRNYKDKEVEEEKIMAVLEAGRIAPSAANRQPWVFIVVREKKNLEKIYGTYARDWIQTAPVIIAICGDHSRAWVRSDGKDHTDVDVSIATDHMTLAATEQGLATCWICAFDKGLCTEVLDLPSHIEPIVLLPMGYPADHVELNRHKGQRKSLEELIKWEKYT